MIDEIINSSLLSKELSGSKTNISSNRVPKKYLEQVEKLNNMIQLWRSGKELVPKEELDSLKQKVKDVLEG